jgi:transcriptional regulator with XRE-family HTH domain
MEAKWFAGRLKELREAAGLTQKELADLAGMSKDGISHLEQGRREPSWASVLAISGALQVSVEAFTIEPRADLPEPRRGRPPKALKEKAQPRKSTPKKSKK